MRFGKGNNMSIISEIDSIIARDPAARSRWEVFFLYPSFHAVIAYRFANCLWRNGWRFLPRLLSQWMRMTTGIEIHPGATIGKNLFIDHGMGVVIGETAEIGDNCTLYQDVTLGGTSPSVNSNAQRNMKRHPTLKNDIIVGSGAQILGPITVHNGARIGGNAVVVKDVPENSTVVGIPGRVVEKLAQTKEQSPCFQAYGLSTDEFMDPQAEIINQLCLEVTALKTRIKELENGQK